MEYVLLLSKQIILMFLLMGIGYWLFKSKKLSVQGNKELATILIYAILPASIIRSFLTEFTSKKLVGFLLSFAAALAALVISILISKIIFGSRKKIEHFGTAFSNAGFIGIPLVKAAVGEEAVFYIASFVALLNILQWTYGVVVMSESKEAVSIRKLSRNPILISLFTGLLFFFTQWNVPALVSNTLSLVGNMTAPVAMITLGAYLAQLSFKELLNEKAAYQSTAVRLLLIPLVTLAVLTLLPNEYRDIKMTVLIATAAPVGSNVAVFAQLNGLDYTRAVKSVCLSTVFCIITMPIILGLAAVIWK